MKDTDTKEIETILKGMPNMMLRGTLEFNLDMLEKTESFSDIEFMLLCGLLRSPFPHPPFKEMSGLREAIRNAIKEIKIRLRCRRSDSKAR